MRNDSVRKNTMQNMKQIAHLNPPCKSILGSISIEKEVYLTIIQLLVKDMEIVNYCSRAAFITAKRQELSLLLFHNWRPHVLCLCRLGMPREINLALHVSQEASKHLVVDDCPRRSR